MLKKDVISRRNWHSFQGLSPALPLKITPSGRGNVPVARNRNPPTQSTSHLGGVTSSLPATPTRNRTNAKNQAIRKNNTIPQSNFHSSWGHSPEFPLSTKRLPQNAIALKSRIRIPSVRSLERGRGEPCGDLRAVPCKPDLMRMDSSAPCRLPFS